MTRNRVKLVMTLVVRDVEDILEANLEFHFQQGVDFVIVTNHASADRTPAILDRYSKSGRVMVIDEPGGPFQQATWVTRMARLAATDLAADWVVNNDCDEFWCHDELTLKAFLETVPADVGVVTARRVNFLPVPETSEPFYRGMVVRERRSWNVYEGGEALQSKVCHRASAHVHVAPGNHRVRGDPALTPMSGVPLVILHYPFRSYWQFEHKIVMGTEALDGSEAAPGAYGTWRRLYAEYRKGRLHEHYERQLLTPEQKAAGLADGSLVEDRRVELVLAPILDTCDVVEGIGQRHELLLRQRSSHASKVPSVPARRTPSNGVPQPAPRHHHGLPTTDKRISVLFTTMPQHSHFHALLPIGLELRDAGHRVAFATAPAFCARITAASMSVYPVGPDFTFADTVATFSEMKGQDLYAARVACINPVVFKETLHDLLRVIKWWQPDLLVSEVNEITGVAAAELSGLPFVRHGVGMAAPSKRQLANGAIDVLRADVGLPDDPEFSWLHRYLLLDNRPRSLRLTDEYISVRHDIRPVQCDEFIGGPVPDWLERLPERTTVYATLDSVFHRKPQVLERVIDDLALEDVNVIVAVGENRDAEQLESRAPNVHVTRCLPQSRLLSRVDVVVSHGGFNTFMGALSHGLPSVMVPMTAENVANARVCLEAGVGWALQGDKLRKGQVRRAVRRVLTDPSYRARAQDLKEEIDMMPGPERVVPVLEWLARERRPYPGYI